MLRKALRSVPQTKPAWTAIVSQAACLGVQGQLRHQRRGDRRCRKPQRHAEELAEGNQPEHAPGLSHPW